MSTWLITGCSTGLGRALAEAVIAAGHNVVATARDRAKIADLAEGNDRVLAARARCHGPGTDQRRSYGGRAEVRRRRRFDQQRGLRLPRRGRGGQRGRYPNLFDTHFFGTVGMIKAVLPGMRARRSGTIVNISSIGATRTPVGSGYYSAAKAAIEGMTGSLRGELEPLGITAMVIEPGGFATDFAGRSLTQSRTVIDDYAETAGKRRKENVVQRGRERRPGEGGTGHHEDGGVRKSSCATPSRKRRVRHLPRGHAEQARFGKRVGGPEPQHRLRQLNTGHCLCRSDCPVATSRTTTTRTPRPSWCRREMAGCRDTDALSTRGGLPAAPCRRVSGRLGARTA